MRIKTALVAALLLLAIVVPARAGIRATIRIEVRATAEAPAREPDTTAAMARSLVQVMFPDGAVEMEWLAQDGAVRSEFHGRTMLLPQGGIVLARAGDTVSRVINPGDQTYFTVQALTATPVAPGSSAVRWEKAKPVPSGTFATIAGHRAEKMTMSWRMKLPVPEGRGLPAGVPDAITISGELWCTDDFKDAVNARDILAGNQMLAMLGIDVAGCSLPLRSVFQTSVMPGYEVRTAITSITEERLPEDLFRIPAGYREVPAPLPQFPK